MRFPKPLALVATAILTTSIASAATVNSLYVQTRTTGVAQGKKQSKLSEVWIKNGKLRMKMGDAVQILDGSSQIMFSMKDPKKQALVVPLPPAMKVRSTPELLKKMFTPPAQIKRKKVGTAKILGHPTVIYDISPPKGGQTMKVWMATDMGTEVPLRQELKDKTGSMTTEAVKIQVNPKLADSLFALPKGYKKMALPKAPPPGSKAKPAPKKK